jgi:2-octaprenyl-6-methoxyphenol hydroxylase
LAGQGFNMTLRDINVLCELIKFRLNCGLELDQSIFHDFEKKTRHKNYIFSSGIDFVYEFFNFESKMKNNILSKSIQLIGKNKFLNKSFEKIANNGF